VNPPGLSQSGSATTTNQTPRENDDDLRDMIGMLYAGNLKAVLIDA
jgi:hypothetical protein